MISDERGERTKQNAGHELEAKITRICKKKMSEDFDISQEETGFPLLKETNIVSFAPAFLRGTRATHTSSSAWAASAYHSQQKWEKKVFIIFEIWIFILQKHIH